MTEIEKMKRYIERTNMDEGLAKSYYIDLVEAFALAKQALRCGDLPIEVISLAFKYGQAKGYRAEKAEGRARV